MIVITIYIVIACTLILASLFGFSRNQHWVFRACEFVRIQLSVLLFVASIAGLLFYNQLPQHSWILLTLMMFLFMYHLFILAPYIPIFRGKSIDKEMKYVNSISVLSINVNQFNQEYSRLISIVQRVNPDILLTMESNEDWKNALTELELKYSYLKSISLENTYGMHFYSNVKVRNVEENYFMADDVPSIKAQLETAEGRSFIFYGIHPPPPSPTEEPTSKERDGELMVIAKQARKSNLPIIVVGDFNNVAWSRSAKLFRKISGLVDVRIGRGFVSTFHAKYKLLRFPIDLLFHSKDIQIQEFKTLEHIGSDHLPLFCRFALTDTIPNFDESVETLNEEDISTANKMIAEGENTDSDRSETVVNSLFDALGTVNLLLFCFLFSSLCY